MAKGPLKGPREEDPALRTVEVVLWLWKNSPERFTANDIANHYEIDRGNAYRRIQYMIVWGMVRRVGEAEAHRAGRKQIVYGLTKWGRQYCSDQSKKGKK
jgi:predicted transcriptional regulator